MNETTATKGIIALITAVFGYLYSCLSELVVILVMFIIMDYVIGILAALRQEKTFDRDKALWGAIKKVLYAFVLVLAFLGDYILLYVAKNAGMTLPFHALFGIAACAYLIGTEGLSIMKHFLVIGVPAPDFLLKFFGLIRDQAGKVIDKPVQEDDNETVDH